LLGVLANVFAVVIGTLIGCLFGARIPGRVKETLMQALGLCVMLIGLKGAITTMDIMGVIVCMVLGTLAGSLIGIEKGLFKLGEKAQKLLGDKGKTNRSVGNAFVTASLVFCVGAMAIVGSLDSGLRGDHATVLAKAALDGVASVVFASTLGAGVALSALAILLYQGGITLLAGTLAPLLSGGVIAEMSAIGGLLVMAIGINMLFNTKIKVGDMLPAIFLPMAYIPLLAVFG
jgi:Uncharacterized membrane protein, possible Na+ channel or pump